MSVTGRKIIGVLLTTFLVRQLTGYIVCTCVAVITVSTLNITCEYEPCSSVFSVTIDLWDTLYITVDSEMSQFMIFLSFFESNVMAVYSNEFTTSSRPSVAPHLSLQSFLTHCGRVTQICVFNTVKLGTSASSP